MDDEDGDEDDNENDYFDEKDDNEDNDFDGEVGDDFCTKLIAGCVEISLNRER